MALERATEENDPNVQRIKRMLELTNASFGLKKPLAGTLVEGGNEGRGWVIAPKTTRHLIDVAYSPNFTAMPTFEVFVQAGFSPSPVEDQGEGRDGERRSRGEGEGESSDQGLGQASKV